MTASSETTAPSPQAAKLEPNSRNPSPPTSSSDQQQQTRSQSSTPTSTRLPKSQPIQPNPNPTNGVGHVPIRPNPTPIAPATTSTSSSNARINKMSMASVISPDPTPPLQLIPRVSVTSKEWVVPPRPKPGRKPATDTPPTKRKAQNRAAQRAFRERRAARVGELEEQLEEQRVEKERVERELNDRIRALELDLQSFRSKCSLLENLLERERQERIRVESEAENLRRRQEAAFADSHARANSLPGIQHHQRLMGNGAGQFRQAHQQVQLTGVSPGSDSQPTARTAMQTFAISQIISPPDHADPLSNSTHITCGNCQPNGPCACVEEALKSVQSTICGECGLDGSCRCTAASLNHVEPLSQPKRSSSPSNPVPSGKRLRPTACEPPLSSNETDFTDAFKKRETGGQAPDKPSQLPSQVTVDLAPRITIPPKDTCGFCDEGTYCVCAEAALSNSSMAETSVSSNSLPSIFSQESQALSPPPEPDAAPPPMEVTSTGAIKLRQRQKPAKKPSDSSSGCGPRGPGTCAQCLADPQSGLFCRTLAAINGSNKSKSGGCCGGRGPGGGCCKSTLTANAANSRNDGNNNKSRPIGISCADAYKTLASHRNFDQAFEEIGTWLPKLKVVKKQEGDERVAPGRPAVEIDAASIMTTLKFLDVRFRANKQ